MDRHVLWLRRRIVASVARQAAITLACTCFIATGLLLLRGTGLVISLAGGLVAGPIVSIARIVQGIRNNPLDYQYLRRFIDSPHRFTIREDRADPHPEAAELLGFYFVVAMHDPDAEPSPVFDLFQSADRRTTAAVSRASGAVSLYSKTVDGRVLVTDSRAMPAHEGLIVNAAPGQHPALLVASHRNACDAVPGGAVPEPLARKIVARAHALEHEAYSQLGPLVGPFFNVEPNRRSLGRLVARIDPSELAMLAPGTPASPRPTTVPRPDPAATADTLGSATASTTAALAPPPAPPSPSVPTQASPPPPSPPVPTFAPPPPPSPPVPTLVPPAPPSPPVPTFAPSGPPSTPSHESVSSAAAFSATTPGSDPLMVIA